MKNTVEYKRTKSGHGLSLMSYCMVFSLLFALCSWKTNEGVKESSGSIKKEQTQKPIEAKKDSDIVAKPEILELIINIEEEEPKYLGNGNAELIFITENPPEFLGGSKALVEYINNNLTYPKKATEMDIQGMVVVRFVINTEGETNDIEVVRPVGGGCDEEAVRLVQSMPKWKPATQMGIPINTSFHLPIRFLLI